MARTSPQGFSPTQANGIREPEAHDNIQPASSTMQESDRSIAPGTVCEVKIVDTVYDPSTRSWAEKVQTSQKDEDAFASYVFLVNRRFSSTGDSDVPTITTVYQIQSSWLRDVGREVIGDNRAISWTAQPLAIEPESLIPFIPVLDRHLSSLDKKIQKSEDESTTISHLTHLLGYLKTSHARVLQNLQSLNEQGRITFDLLWSILTPGVILYTSCTVTSEPRAVRLIRASKETENHGKPAHWKLHCEYVDVAETNNSLFGFAHACFELNIFDGSVPITSLPTYPIEWYPSTKTLMEDLMKRGKTWSNLTAINHRRYDGIAFHFVEEKYPRFLFGKPTPPERCLITGRIIVDRQTFSAFEYNHDIPKAHGSLKSLDNYALLLTPAMVYGFSLSNNLWLAFCVRLVQEIEWNDNLFTNLVLPPNQKELIKALVKDHNESRFDDFIQGKGRGLVVDLFGKPGVGKSLTVEAISECLHRPLYVISAGDLGATASSIDKELRRVFKITAIWNAVVVIDEADVFLEERSLRDLERNAMVAVFLRHLEYFHGILFLTTNRVSVFDEAFQSRIHVSIHYPDLTSDARKEIWMGFLRKVKQDESDSLTPEQIRDLAERDINGRQIKNIVKTASALAKGRNQTVNYAHLVEVLDIMVQFESRYVCATAYSIRP
ncbi:P-loop containing nucleoside triphosphate hydrolase protein [Amanita rubescens]|nr:P-loop containing nucleoside triphosphate hydrolase protein [Amanita rubescens]